MNLSRPWSKISTVVSYSEGTERYLAEQRSENIKTPKSILSTKVKLGITTMD